MLARDLWHRLNDLGEAPEKMLKKAREAMEEVEWRHKEGPDMDFWVADCNSKIPFNGFRRAMFIKVPPGGRIHEHNDGYEGRTYHVPLETNEDTHIFFRDDEDEVYEYHMAVGKIYEIDRKILHWTKNEGETNRVHLMIETTT